MNDVFHRIYEWYIIWAGNVPDRRLITIIRLTLLFAVPAAIYYWTFISRHREGFGRFIASFLADGLVLAIPIRVPSDVTARAWIFTMCVLLLAYLPGMLPFLVCKAAGCQRRLRIGLFMLAGTLLLIGMLWS